MSLYVHMFTGMVLGVDLFFYLKCNVMMTLVTYYDVEFEVQPPATVIMNMM